MTPNSKKQALYKGLSAAFMVALIYIVGLQTLGFGILKSLVLAFMAAMGVGLIVDWWFTDPREDDFPRFRIFRLNSVKKQPPNLRTAMGREKQRLRKINPPTWMSRSLDRQEGE